MDMPLTRRISKDVEIIDYSRGWSNLKGRVTSTSGASGCGLMWSRASCALVFLLSTMASAKALSPYFSHNCLYVIHLLAPVLSKLWTRFREMAYELFPQSSLLPSHSSHRIAIVSGPGLSWMDRWYTDKTRQDNCLIKNECRSLLVVSWTRDSFAFCCTCLWFPRVSLDLSGHIYMDLELLYVCWNAQNSAISQYDTVCMSAPLLKDL